MKRLVDVNRAIDGTAGAPVITLTRQLMRRPARSQHEATR